MPRTQIYGQALPAAPLHRRSDTPLPRPALLLPYQNLAIRYARMSGSLTCGMRSNAARPCDVVLAVLVAAIHDFGAADKDVDGRNKPCHDMGKGRIVSTILDRTSVLHSPVFSRET